MVYNDIPSDNLRRGKIEFSKNNVPFNKYIDRSSTEYIVIQIHNVNQVKHTR